MSIVEHTHSGTYVQRVHENCRTYVYVRDIRQLRNAAARARARQRVSGHARPRARSRAVVSWGAYTEKSTHTRDNTTPVTAMYLNVTMRAADATASDKPEPPP
jgi:hypothetical protein